MIQINEKYTGNPAPKAYADIKKFFKKFNFEHRQGSGYISKDNIKNNDIIILITKMAIAFQWLSHCIKQIDVTNIGKQYSMVEKINETTNQFSMSVADIEIKK